MNWAALLKRANENMIEAESYDERLDALEDALEVTLTLLADRENWPPVKA